MSNEIVNKPPQALSLVEQEIANEAREDVAKFQQGVARVSFMGGNITIDGQEVKGNKLTVAVISTVFGKAYYLTAFDPSTPQTPVCYAFHPSDQSQMAPHEAAPDKQAETCVGCQWNKFGTAERGKGKRCKDEIRLMVVAPSDDLSGAEVRMLSIPPGSLQNWGKYVARLAEAGATVRSVLTEISVVPYKGAYKLEFHPAGKLSEAQYVALKNRRGMAEEQSMQPYPVLDEDEPEETPKQKQAKARRSQKLD